MKSGVSRSARSHSFRPYRSFGAIVVWEYGHQIDDIKLIKHITFPKNLSVWENIYIQKKNLMSRVSI